MEILLIETLYKTSEYVTRVFSDGNLNVVVDVSPSQTRVFPALKDGHLWHWYTDEMILSSEPLYLVEGQRTIATESIIALYDRLNDDQA